MQELDHFRDAVEGLLLKVDDLGLEHLLLLRDIVQELHLDDRVDEGEQAVLRVGR